MKFSEENHDQDFEYSDAEDIQPEAHNKLLNAVSKIYKKQRIEKPQRREPTSQISEFNLSNKASENDRKLVNVSELVKILNKRATHHEIKKKVIVMRNKGKPLPKPMEKLHSDKIRRHIGYQNVRKQLNRWEAIVQRNRAAEQLQFPLQSSEKLEIKESSDFLHTFKEPTELEKQMAAILQTSEIAQEDKKKEEELFPLSLNEIIERRKMVAYMRARESYKIAKATRQNKIKSKKYHRILKRERIKKELKDFELLQKTNPEAALEKLEKIERARAEERITLRHKSTGKWARSRAIVAKYDIEARKQLAEQLAKSRELTKKVQSGLNSNSESEEGDNEIDEEDILQTDPSNPWKPSTNEQTGSEIASFISGYKKYQKNKSDEVKVLENSRIHQSSGLESADNTNKSDADFQKQREVISTKNIEIVESVNIENTENEAVTVEALSEKDGSERVNDEEAKLESQLTTEILVEGNGSFNKKLNLTKSSPIRSFNETNSKKNINLCHLNKESDSSNVSKQIKTGFENNSPKSVSNVKEEMMSNRKDVGNFSIHSSNLEEERSVNEGGINKQLNIVNTDLQEKPESIDYEDDNSRLDSKKQGESSDEENDNRYSDLEEQVQSTDEEDDNIRHLDSKKQGESTDEEDDIRYLDLDNQAECSDEEDKQLHLEKASLSAKVKHSNKSSSLVETLSFSNNKRKRSESESIKTEVYCNTNNKKQKSPLNDKIKQLKGNKSTSEVKELFNSKRKSETENEITSVHRKKLKPSKVVKTQSGVWSVSPVVLNNKNYKISENITKDNKNSNTTNISIDKIFDNAENTLKKSLNSHINQLKTNLRVNEEEKLPAKKKNSKYRVDLSLKPSNKRVDIDSTLIEVGNEGISSGSNEVKSLMEIYGSDKTLDSNNKELPNIDPQKFLPVKASKLNSGTLVLEEVQAESADEEDDDERRQLNLEEAFADDDIVDEFRREKEEDIENSKPKEINLSLPGWGHWAGHNIDVQEERNRLKRKSRRLIFKFPDIPRKDDKKDYVIINEELPPTLKNHMVHDLPFPFKSVRDYETSIRAPVGNTWIPRSAFMKLIQPAVVTKMGTVIQPMSENELLDFEKKKPKKLK